MYKHRIPYFVETDLQMATFPIFRVKNECSQPTAGRIRLHHALNINPIPQCQLLRNCRKTAVMDAMYDHYQPNRLRKTGMMIPKNASLHQNMHLKFPCPIY